MTGNTLVTHCDCSDPAHMMQFNLMDGDDPREPELYISVQLNPVHPWWRRVWIAAGYILGKRSCYSYGHWDEGSINEESAKELIVLLGRYFSMRAGDSKDMKTTPGNWTPHTEEVKWPHRNNGY